MKKLKYNNRLIHNILRPLYVKRMAQDTYLPLLADQLINKYISRQVAKNVKGHIEQLETYEYMISNVDSDIKQGVIDAIKLRQLDTQL